MMRYQRVSPDCLPLSNGKKSSVENGRLIPNGLNSSASSSNNFEAKGLRFRSPSRNQDHHHGAPSPPHSDSNHSQTQKPETSSSPGGGDVLLQWGQKKRARVSRSEMRALADESSSSGQPRQAINKVPRRLDHNPKLYASTMPPPPPLPQGGGSFRKESSVFLPHRNLEKRSSAANGSPSRNNGGNSRVVSRSTAAKRSPPTPDKFDRKMHSSRSVKDGEKPNGSTAQGDHVNHVDAAPTQSEQETGIINTPPVAAAVEKILEWPRIYIALSRKEKEDDFFAMKGTKLPQRPKKRAKNIDKTLQYCFPGMWLSDLSKSRYEVREKKSVKKQKRRGLKGLESMDSDSE